jgi:hypothetical protein
MAPVSERIQTRAQTIYGYLEVKTWLLKSLRKQIANFDKEKE